MSNILNPLPSNEILKRLVSDPLRRSWPVQVEDEWFDPEYVGKEEEGYPFFLGLWAHRFVGEMKDVLVNLQHGGKPMGTFGVRTDLVFCYTVGDKFYRGIVRFDTPMSIQISVRVSEKHHLKIRADGTTLCTVNDDVDMKEWRITPLNGGLHAVAYRLTKTVDASTWGWDHFCTLQVHRVPRFLLNVFQHWVDSAVKRPNIWRTTPNSRDVEVLKNELIKRLQIPSDTDFIISNLDSRCQRQVTQAFLELYSEMAMKTTNIGSPQYLENFGEYSALLIQQAMEIRAEFIDMVKQMYAQQQAEQA